MRAVTTIIAITVVADPNSGISPSTTMRWMIVALRHACSASPSAVPGAWRIEFITCTPAKVPAITSITATTEDVGAMPRSPATRNRPGVCRLLALLGRTGWRRRPARCWFQSGIVWAWLDGNLDRQRPEQGKRRRQELEPQHQHDVRPVRPRIRGEAAVIDNRSVDNMVLRELRSGGRARPARAAGLPGVHHACYQDRPVSAPVDTLGVRVYNAHVGGCHHA